jgi:hypothetical protein
LYYEELGFSIQLPEGWLVTREGGGGLHSPLEGESDFQENAVVRINSIDHMGPGPHRIANVVPEIREIIAGLNNGTVISETDCTIAGTPGLAITYTYEDPESGFSGKAKCIAFNVISNGQFGYVAFTALEPDFDRWLDTFEAIGKTFQIE